MIDSKQFMRQHPEFPWLIAGDVALVEACVASLGWLGPFERVQSCETAGEGNMNLTLRIETSTRRFILKQARPWVEKYPSIPAPWERGEVEQAFYAAVSQVPGVASLMPEIYGADPHARIIAMELLEDASDFTDLYQTRQALDAETLTTLAHYAATLHTSLAPPFDAQLQNSAMRVLNHEHMYVLPWQTELSLPLDEFEPGLSSVAAELRESQVANDIVAMLGEIYLSDGATLLHGDFFPGSWMRTAQGLRVIDPEFCFPGPPEFDLGVAIAHLRLCAQNIEAPYTFLEAYANRAGRSLNHSQLARFAAAEVVRRIIGVAQLPLPRGGDFRARAVKAASATLYSGTLEDLWIR